MFAVVPSTTLRASIPWLSAVAPVRAAHQGDDRLGCGTTWRRHPWRRRWHERARNLPRSGRPPAGARRQPRHPAWSPERPGGGSSGARNPSTHRRTGPRRTRANNAAACSECAAGGSRSPHPVRLARRAAFLAARCCSPIKAGIAVQLRACGRLWSGWRDPVRASPPGRTRAARSAASPRPRAVPALIACDDRREDRRARPVLHGGLPGISSVQSSKRPSWMSRSRTSPSRAASQPSSARKRPALTGSTVGEHVETRAHPPRCHPHLMEGLDVLSQSRARHVCEHRRGILAKHPVGELAERRGRTYPGGPEVRRTRDAEPGCHEARLELGQGRRLEAALASQSLHEGLHRIHPGRLHLHLDTGQAEPSALVSDRDHGVVQRELANSLAVDREIEGTSPRPNLQHLLERATLPLAPPRAIRPHRRGPAPDMPDSGKA